VPHFSAYEKELYVQEILKYVLSSQMIDRCSENTVSDVFQVLGISSEPAFMEIYRERSRKGYVLGAFNVAERIGYEIPDDELEALFNAEMNKKDVSFVFGFEHIFEKAKQPLLTRLYCRFLEKYPGWLLSDNNPKFTKYLNELLEPFRSQTLFRISDNRKVDAKIREAAKKMITLPEEVLCEARVLSTLQGEFAADEVFAEYFKSTEKAAFIDPKAKTKPKKPMSLKELIESDSVLSR
jgi:hypothetical protein